MLFVPGNDPGKLLNAGIYHPDSIVFDLEDAVSIHEKDAARDLVKNAIKYNEYPCEIGVRVNHISTPYGYDDLAEILKVCPDFIRLPKAEDEEDIVKVDTLISQAEQKYGYEPGRIKMILTIETAKGIMNSYKLAIASKRVVAIGIGAEDLTADLKTTRTKTGQEIFFARNYLLLSARAAGIQAIDNVFADVMDIEGFMADVRMGKQLGFDGKSVIHPKHVALVHQIYAPTENEIVKAQQILAAYQQALANKSGVIALNGKMIDGPIVARAERVLQYARVTGAFEDGGQQ